MRREREREKKERGAYHGGPSPIKRILLFELNSIRVDRLIVRSRSRTCGRIVTSADPWPRRSRIIIGGTPRVGTRADRKSPSVRHECSPHVRRTIGQKGLIRPRRFPSDVSKVYPLLQLCRQITMLPFLNGIFSVSMRRHSSLVCTLSIPSNLNENRN